MINRSMIHRWAPRFSSRRIQRTGIASQPDSRFGLRRVGPSVHTRQHEIRDDRSTSWEDPTWQRCLTGHVAIVRTAFGSVGGDSVTTAGRGGKSAGRPYPLFSSLYPAKPFPRSSFFLSLSPLCRKHFFHFIHFILVFFSFPGIFNSLFQDGKHGKRIYNGLGLSLGRKSEKRREEEEFPCSRFH